ncbi:hypothetical protein TcWFU_003541 [Taenia crassiceps]|uniref:Uncharacterized protein n=1 Tax=Taenia crassiceps TaxID=6207 RepID=A0ABR4Q4C2_9CEST
MELPSPSIPLRYVASLNPAMSPSIQPAFVTQTQNRTNMLSSPAAETKPIRSPTTDLLVSSPPLFLLLLPVSRVTKHQITLWISSPSINTALIITSPNSLVCTPLTSSMLWRKNWMWISRCKSSCASCCTFSPVKAWCLLMLSFLPLRYLTFLNAAMSVRMCGTISGTKIFDDELAPSLVPVLVWLQCRGSGSPIST